MNMESFSEYDNPMVTEFLFHPRKEEVKNVEIPGKTDLFIETEDGEAISGSLFESGRDSPTMLYFHGNGEIISDYDDLGRIFMKKDVNFFPIDYRGYGRSTGEPSVSSMMSDSHLAYSFARNLLVKNSFTGKFVVMGRSLGSASALELASTYNDEIDALIIESGFAFSVPLMNFLGVDTEAIGLREEAGFRNIDKISLVTKPTLVIHAEKDHIIPFTDGEALYRRSRAEYKKFIEIKNANHNNIFLYGLNEYFAGIEEIINYIR